MQRRIALAGSAHGSAFHALLRALRPAPGRRSFPVWCRGLSAAALIAVAATGCSGGSSDDDGDRERGPRVTPVAVVQPERGDVEGPFLEREATLYPISYARIATRQDGWVRVRHIEMGDVLHAGDPIAELDDTEHELRLLEARAALARAQATLAERKRALARGEELFRQKVISPGSRDDLAAAYARAEADVQEARAVVERSIDALQQLVIVSPMEAVVTGRLIERGEYVERGDVIAELKRVDTIMAQCTVSERNIDRVREGAPVEVLVSAFPGRVFEGLIWRVIPDAVIESRSFPVRVLLANPDYELKTGMSARIRFLDKVDNALLVPKDAIVREGDRDFVYVAAEDKAERREVQLGMAFGERRHVRSGLDAEALVVVTGNESLEDGDPIQVVAVPPKGPSSRNAPLRAGGDGASGS